MKHMNVLKKYGARAVSAVSTMTLPVVASAQSSAIAAGATDALGDTQADVTSVAVIVAGVVALMAAAGLIFAMLKKG